MRRGRTATAATARTSGCMRRPITSGSVTRGGGADMARIAEADIERLKAEVSLVRLVEEAGIPLARQGKDWAARCPFHEEDTASLIVTPAKNLFHCFGCGAAGGPID